MFSSAARMPAQISFAIALSTLTATVSGAAIQKRDIFCTPEEGLCAYGIQTNIGDNAVATNWDVTVYDSACNKIGGTTFPEMNHFPSLDSQLPFTIETDNIDYNTGAATTFRYAGLTFGGLNNGLKWSCAACNNGKAECCGYAFVGPGCSSTWDKAPCTTVPITDESIDQAVRWKSVDTEGAWNAAIAAWNAEPNKGGLTFSAQISNFFHGPSGFNCADTSDGSGCRGGVHIECDDRGSKPAAHLILNSFLTISDLIMNIYTGIDHSQSAMNTQIGEFSGTFAPTYDTQKDLKMILDIVGLGFAVGAAPIWNSAIKGFAYFAKEAKNENTLGTLKDTTNGLVSNGISIAKDLSTATLNVQNEIQKDMGDLVETWKNALGGMKKKLFDGLPESIDLLHGMITDGKMLVPGNFADDFTVQKAVEKALYGVLIPQAWSLSNEDVHPFILDAGVPCGTVNPLLDFVSEQDGNNNWACANGKLYYLLQVTGDASNCPEGKDRQCTKNYFTGLPGSGQLDGKSWGNLSKEDFIAGAVAGFSANGNKNGWKAADPMNADVMNSIANDVVRAPGVINIPVCGASEARLNWVQKTSANYPCN